MDRTYRILQVLVILCIISLLLLTATLLYILYTKEDVERVPGRSWYTLDDFSTPIDSPNLEPAVMAGCYLVNCQLSDGSFNYQYDPLDNDYSSKNNLLRQLGTTYSVLLLYRHYPEPIFLEAGELAMEYIEDNLDYIDEDVAHVELNGDSKLGGAALAVLCYVIYEKVADEKYSTSMEALGNFFIYMQKDSGEFHIYYKWDGKVLEEGDEKYNEHTDYYPGEAMLALSFLYEHTGAEKYKDCWDKAFDYYYDFYGGAHSYYSPFSPWAVGAAQIMYMLDQDPRYVNMSRAMSDSVLYGQDQYPSDFNVSEYVGGFYYRSYLRYMANPDGDPDYYPRANTASKIEPPCDFYWLVKKYDAPGDESLLEERIILASEFLTNLQYNSSESENMPSPKRTYGGVPGGVEDPEVRIDYNQHAIVAWLKVYDYVEKDRPLLF